MKIIIDQSILDQFADVKIGVLICNNVNNNLKSIEISKLMRDAEEAIRNKKIQDVTMLPKINDWRQAYRKFGCNPSQYRNSVEALLRRIIQGKELPTINPIVDIYNLISITYLLPAGGGNMDKVEGDIVLKKAQGNEKFTMLGTTEPILIPEGEVIYSDDKDVLCRAWNYRESDKTKITNETKNIYLLLEGLENTSTSEIEQALAELKKLIINYCGGNCKTYLLDLSNPNISI